MKCPKCGYVSHDYLDSCRKCSIDLVDFKSQMLLYSIKAGDINLVSLLSDAQPTFATSTGLEEPFFNTSMLVDSNTEDDFDISLDNDLNISPVGISIVDESLDASKLTLSSKPDADQSAMSSDSKSDDHDGLGPPQSGYATIMLDVSDFESKLSELDRPTTEDSEAQTLAGTAGEDGLEPLGEETPNDPTSSINPDWVDDPMSTVETRAIASPFSSESVKENDKQMPEIPVSFDGPASDVYELLDADVSRIEFDDTTLSASAFPAEEIESEELAQNADMSDISDLSDVDLHSHPEEVSAVESTQCDATLTQDLFPDLPEISTDDSGALEPASEAETLVDAFDASDVQAVMPELPLFDNGNDEPQDPSSNESTIIEDDFSSAWMPEKNDTEHTSDKNTMIDLDIDAFEDAKITDEAVVSNSPASWESPSPDTSLDHNEDPLKDSQKKPDNMLPDLESDSQESAPSSAELETLVDTNCTFSDDKMPDLSDLSFDSDATSEESTLVDDVLASELGLSFSEDNFELPSADLPHAWTDDIDESSSKDDDSKSNNA